MKHEAATPEHCTHLLPEENKDALMLSGRFPVYLPDGFAGGIANGKIGCPIHRSVYPAAYHPKSKQPLPFTGSFFQRNHSAINRMDVCADASLISWFVAQYPKHTTIKDGYGRKLYPFQKAIHSS